MKQTFKIFRNLMVIVMAVCMIQPLAAQSKEKKGEKVTTFNVDLDCQSCVNNVENKIKWEKGVTDLQCDLAAKTVTVTYKTSRTDDEKLIAAFKKLGKEATVKCGGNPANCDKKDNCAKKSSCAKEAKSGCGSSCGGHSHAH